MMQQQPMAEQSQTGQPTMAQQMPQQIPQQLPQQMPQQMPQQIPQQMPQQMAQQMVLCPVRVVYETQILMQPDQMHPNQTFFINPQNQPPWAHNRQMPNQVFYVQHPANNIMPSMPQHMEQNHFYVQQPYQHIVHHPMLAQNQDNIMRSYQMPMTTNMLQNVQSNIGTHYPNQMSQHNDPIPNYGIVNSNASSNIPIPSITQTNTMPVDRQEMVMQGNQNQNVPNQKQMYINVGQQTNQQGIVRTQLMTLNPMQQTSSSAQMFDQTSQNISTNTPQLPQVIPRTFVNTKTNTQPIRMRTVTLNNVQPTNIRTIDQNYACRPIKPRPEYRPNISSYPNAQIQVPQVINTVNVNPTVYNKVSNQLATTVSNNDSNKINRKRKSESPDALNPKLTVVNMNTTIAQPLVNNHVKSIDVGINTIPIYKPNNYTLHKPNNNNTINKITAQPIPQDLKPSTEDHKTITIQKTKQEDIETKPAIDTKDVKQDDSNKIVRYTVFPQARVRVTEEVKLNVNILKDTKNIINAGDKKVEPKVENSKILLKEKILSKNDEKNSKVNETLLTGVNANVMNSKDSHEKGKEFVLTHVLDGLVIQESNIAFPIRDSTKKTVQAETKSSDKKREVIKVDDLLKNNCLELPISDRNLQEKANEDEEKNDCDNPFVNINATTVKSWTIDQLTSYLSKYKWDETVSLLQEHEIDGESLFLVTKPQLLQIGIKEKHADLICEYTKS